MTRAYSLTRHGNWGGVSPCGRRVLTLRSGDAGSGARAGGKGIVPTFCATCQKACSATARSDVNRAPTLIRRLRRRSACYRVVQAMPSGPCWGCGLLQCGRKRVVISGLCSGLRRCLPRRCGTVLRGLDAGMSGHTRIDGRQEAHRTPVRSTVVRIPAQTQPDGTSTVVALANGGRSPGIQ